MSTPAEILTVEQMMDADRRAIESGVSSSRLMERAGEAVAAAAARIAGRGARIVVACGPGNNGGDGYAAARLLMQRGFEVDVVSLCPRAALKGDAAEMAAQWKGPVHKPGAAVLAGADLIVDALFGAGLTRGLEGEAAQAVAWINAAQRPVLSVDVPSGLDADSGKAEGAVVRPTETVTFFRRKQGHVSGQGAELCRRVSVADIGIPESVLADLGAVAVANTPERWLAMLRPPERDAHKYSRGHAVVVSGPAETTGAARLAARAALRAGAGLVTVASPRAAFPVNAAQLTSVMVQPFTVPDGLGEVLADTRRNAVLVGPGAGVGEATGQMIDTVLATRASVVLDADALTTIAEDMQGFCGKARSRLNGSSGGNGLVLTPHVGEFSRLFPDLANVPSRLERARGAAERTGCVVLLKGPETVIASPPGSGSGGSNGLTLINFNAPAWLATAGTGDVLAGFITGLLAQGMPAFEAAAAAAWMHGECANAFGPGLIAEDLPEVLPQVLRSLYEHKARDGRLPA